jgi:TonB family protein
MKAPANDSLAWPARKLVVAIVIALGAQVVLIHWFSARGELKTRMPDARPALQLFNGVRSEWLRITDPTLFARAHPDGVSATAWLDIPTHNYRPAEAPDAPAWLALAPERLGATFQEYVKNYQPEGVSLRSWQPPSVTEPTRLRYPPMPESHVRVQGPLAARGILSTPPLPAWTNADILRPTRVQVLVDAWGNPMTAALLQSSGLAEADQAALAISQKIAFGPQPPNVVNATRTPETDLTPGWLIFTWRTLAPATNGIPNPN